MTDELYKEEIIHLYNQHVDMIYRICYLYLKNRADAEDAVQTVFVKLISVNPAFTCPNHAKAWLVTTAKNHCKNILKSSWFKTALSQVNSEAIPDAFFVVSQDHTVTEQLLSLPEKYKLPLYLFYYEGYKIREISQILKTKESTIKSRLKAAKQKLQLQLKEEEYEI